MNIPVPYKAILEKVNGNFSEDLIPSKDFRKYVANTFRCNKQIINRMVIEMKEMGLICYINKGTIRVLKK